MGRADLALLQRWVRAHRSLPSRIRSRRSRRRRSWTATSGTLCVLPSSSCERCWLTTTHEQENHENNLNIRIDPTEINQIINIFNVKSSVIQINGKVNAVSLGPSPLSLPHQH